jgi:SAM-dependent methyltransferase
VDSTERFGDRVEHYHRFRPSYPGEILSLLEKEIGFSPAKTVADIGAGTGISAELFVRYGNPVYAVEPNAQMRMKAEATLGMRRNFRSIEGRAEQTHLDDRSVDLIVSAQAFHWFDRAASKAEFRRIARQDGFVLLIWNDRRLDTPFERAYEEFLEEYGTDYLKVKRAHVPEEEVREWFQPVRVRLHTLANSQQFDAAGLRGRVLSSSYMPNEGNPLSAGMLTALDRLFEAHNSGGSVQLTYDVKLCLGAAHPA